MKPTHLFAEQASGTTVDLSIDEAVTILLEENPTTGFRWRIESSGTPTLSLLAEHFHPDSGRPGGGGTHEWHFRAVARGQVSIKMTYRRRGGAAAREFILVVRASG